MPTTESKLLSKIDHIVVIMLENRSFDHMLGFLYHDEGNRSPRGQPFEGLTGDESNSNAEGETFKVYPLKIDDPYLYFTPHADPGEGFWNTLSQLYGHHRNPNPVVAPTNQGFVTNYAYTLDWQSKSSGWHIWPGARPDGIMAMHTRETLPVLSSLARGYAVCDHWYCSLPTETVPNRAFLHMATSEGILKDLKGFVYTTPSIYPALSKQGATWRVYKYGDRDANLTRQGISDLVHAADSHFGDFDDFQTAAADGTLANYSFLEPAFGPDGNSEHPNYNVSAGEQFLYAIYQTLVRSAVWDKTLLIITYDEHGGCYDHVPPPANAAPPVISRKPDYGFDFKRFGVRVPTVLVSPWIEAGTVYRTSELDGYQPGKGDPATAPTPFDHTSILKTLEVRFQVPSLTARDAAAPHVGGVLSRTSARTDNVLAAVTPPSAQAPGTDGPREPGHLNEMIAHHLSQVPDPFADGHQGEMPHFERGRDMMDWALARYKRYRQWQRSNQ